MLRRTLQTGLLAASLAAAVVGPATAATAQSATITDGTGDVWENTYDPTTQSDVWSLVDSAYNTDVVSTVITHGARRVNVKMTYNDLDKAADVNISAVVNMRFDQGARRSAFVDVWPGDWQGSSTVFKQNPTGGAPVTCGGLTHAVDYTANTVSMSIPRTCLGSPTWIQANVLSRSTAGLDQDVQRNLLDNGQQAGHTELGWSGRLRRG